MSRNDASSVVVLSNVSMTTGTLTNLRLDESYAVDAQMCTRVGCGPPSQFILITQDSPGLFCLQIPQHDNVYLHLIYQKHFN